MKSIVNKKSAPKSTAGATTGGPSPFEGLARECTRALKPYVPGRSIEEVREQYGPKRIVKLGSNENPLGADPRVIKALQGALKRIHLYPDGSSGSLREVIAKKYGLLREQVVVGNGSDEVMLLLTLAFLKPGEKVLVSENTFSEYEFSGRVMDGAIQKIPLRDLCYDTKAFAAAMIEKPRFAFLCNPNNPTGTYFTHEALLEVMQAAPADTLVIVDEAYGDFATAKDFPRTLELMKHYPNLAVVRTFSKLYGLAGLRLGYLLAHSDVAQAAYRVKTPFNVNLLVQTAALTALANKTFVSQSLKVNRAGKKQIEAGLKKLKLQFLPTQGNFICFKVNRPAVELCEDLLKQGVIIRALRSFGLEFHCRVTIGTLEQNAFFLKHLAKVL